MSLLVKAFLLNISAPLQTSSLSTVRLQSSVLTFAIGLSTTLSVDAKKQFLICACFRYTCEHDFFLELTHDLQLVEGLPHSAALCRTLPHSEQQFRPGIRGTWKGFRQLTHPCFSVYVIYLRRTTCHSLAACTSAACSLATCSLAVRPPGFSSPGLLVPWLLDCCNCCFLHYFPLGMYRSVL